MTIGKTRPAWCLLSALFVATALIFSVNTAWAFDIRGIFKGKQLAASESPVDAREAVATLNAYRKSKGLGPVQIDAKLTRIAADHALQMAKADKVAHVLRGQGSFSRRLRDGGYDAAYAAENLGGGYKSVSEAFNGWKRSREHDKNLLKPEFTVIGIAQAYSAGSKYKTYWSLVLAAPYEGPPPGSGPTAGPLIMIR